MISALCNNASSSRAVVAALTPMRSSRSSTANRCFQSFNSSAFVATQTRATHSNSKPTAWTQRLSVLGNDWLARNKDAPVRANAGDLECLAPVMRVAVRTSFKPATTPTAAGASMVDESMSASSATRSLCALYASIGNDDDARASFFNVLAQTLALDAHKLSQTIHATPSKDSLSDIDLASLREALTPGYEHFWQQVVSHFRGGVPFLVGMRADLIQTIKTQSKQEGLQEQHKQLKAMDVSLREYLTTIFRAGLLELNRVSLDSPGTLLDKVIVYEQVHLYRGLADLKRRFGDGRRCFGFFHSSMPNEPLVFVHVALVGEIASSMHYLNEQADALHAIDDAHTNSSSRLNLPHAGGLDASANTTPAERQTKAAIFYSISATQAGLRGVDLGVYLIKNVVDVLQRDLPQLEIFCTLSPLPRFVPWLIRQLKDEGAEKLLTTEEDRTLLDVCDLAVKELGMAETDITPSGSQVLACIVESLAWHKLEWACDVCEGPLMRLAAVYLCTARAPGSQGAKAACSVANFHIRNGAVLERVNFLADTSLKGMRNSAGLMANYNYVLDSVDFNSEAYQTRGVVTTSEMVKRLLQQKQGE